MEKRAGTGKQEKWYHKQVLASKKAGKLETDRQEAGKHESRQTRKHVDRTGGRQDNR
jgi:hypothetical protein